MKPLPLLVVAIAAFSPILATAAELSPGDAAKSAHYAANAKGQPTFLNLG
jgi:hypothetical protein